VDAPPALVEVESLSSRLRSAVEGLIASLVAESPAPAAPTDAPPIEEGRAELATLTSPVHLAVGAFLAIQGRRTLARWLGGRSRWKAAAESRRRMMPTPHLNRSPSRAGEASRERTRV
jgi:hypothetical protein